MNGEESARKVVTVTESDLEVLKANVNKLVWVRCRDGEVFVGNARFISEEDQDLIYHLVSTSKESQYENSTSSLNT